MCDCDFNSCVSIKSAVDFWSYWTLLSFPFSFPRFWFLPFYVTDLLVSNHYYVLIVFCMPFNAALCCALLFMTVDALLMCFQKIKSQNFKSFEWFSHNNICLSFITVVFSKFFFCFPFSFSFFKHLNLYSLYHVLVQIHGYHNWY